MAILSFTLISLSPIDPITAYLGTERTMLSAQEEENIIRRFGLDKPPITRFFLWTKQALRGNFGESIIYNEPVAQVIKKRFANSFWLMFPAWIIAGLLGFFLGTISGAFPYSHLDKSISFYGFTFCSIPSFWLALIFLSFFSVYLTLTPICCAGPLGIALTEVSIFTRIYHLILPVLVLVIIEAAHISLHAREKMLSSLQSNYARFALATGESQLQIAFRHGVRNVSLPVMTLQFASLGELFGGSILIEKVFSYPGIGHATTEAALRSDIPLLLGISLFMALFVFCGNTMADILQRIINPQLGEKNAF